MDRDVDVTDNVNSFAELLATTEINAFAAELPGIDDADELSGCVELPAEIAAIPDDCKDLLRRLLDYDPKQRIRSMFKLQRIAFYMGYSFEDVKKKRVSVMEPFRSLGASKADKIFLKKFKKSIKKIEKDEKSENAEIVPPLSNDDIKSSISS